MAANSSYGTLSSNTRPENGLIDAADQERAALLSKIASGSNMSARLHKYMTANVSKSWGDLTLLGCYIITGLLDSASVQVWGSFVSMQTGTQALGQRHGVPAHVR